MRHTKKIVTMIALLLLGVGVGLTVGNARTITKKEPVTVTKRVEIPVIEYRDNPPTVEIKEVNRLSDNCENQRRISYTEAQSACVSPYELTQIQELCLNAYESLEWSISLDIADYRDYQPLANAIKNTWANCENINLAP